MTELKHTEDLYNKKYKSMMEAYRYGPENTHCVSFSQINMTGVNVAHSMAYMVRGVKYYIIADDEGNIYVLSRGLTYLAGPIPTGEPILKLKKQQITIIFLHQNRVGFLKFQGWDITNTWCHGGTYNLTDFTVDSANNGYIYASTTDNEILIFEAERMMSNPVDLSCKIVGKLATSVNKEDSGISINALRQSLVVMSTSGIEVFNKPTTASLMRHPNSYPVETAEGNFTDLYFDHARAFNGDYLLH